MSLGWFMEPDSRPETEEITRKVSLWLKKGNVKEIIISHLYRFPSGNKKVGTLQRKKLQFQEKKEMRNISTNVGLVPTKEPSMPLKMSIWFLIKLTKLIKLAMGGC